MAVTDPSPRLGAQLTIVIPARNEAGRLPLVLRNFARMAHVLVVDNFSTDNTAAIAAEFGRPVIQVANAGGFVETPAWMEPVWAAIKTPYMLLAACGEYVPATLLETYAQVAESGSHDVVLAKRVSITAGLPIPIDLPPRWINFRYKGELRFYKRGAVSYEGNQVHGRGQILAGDRVLVLPQREDRMFYQFRDYDAAETEEKHRIYNDVLGAQLAGRPGYAKTCLKCFLRGIKQFVFCYFIYGGFRHGMKGFMHSYYRLHMQWGIGFRVYEHATASLKSDIRKQHLAQRTAFLTQDGL